MDPSPARPYLLASACLVAGYLLLPAGPVRDLVYLAIGLSSGLAILFGVRRHRPRRREAWHALAASQLLWTLGDAIYFWDEDVRGVEPFPGRADICYLAAYIVLVAGFALLLRDRQTGRDRDGLLDSSIFTIGVGLLTWVLVVHPVFTATSSSLWERSLGFAYPTADVLLFGLLVRLLTTPGSRTTSFRMLLAGGGLLFGADTAFALLNLRSPYEGGAVDLLWLGSYAFWGAAALHSSMRTLSEPCTTGPATFTLPRLLALTTAGLVAPATLAVQLAFGIPLDAWAVAISSGLLFLLVIARMAGLLSRLQAQAGELEQLSRTDGLTGLPNRRSGEAELSRALSAHPAGRAVHVAMLDLDHFKAFNDTLGHQAGDRLLTDAATRWTRRLAPGQVLARWGGEEFVLLVMGSSTAEVVELLGGLRAATPAGQTFSAGLARWDGVESEQQLLHRADVSLFEAKHAGRDRVVLADAVTVS